MRLFIGAVAMSHSVHLFIFDKLALTETKRMNQVLSKSAVVSIARSWYNQCGTDGSW